MRHLLVTYSWSTGNIGDVAITPGFLALSGRYLPDIPLRVMTLQSASDQRFPDIARYLKQYAPTCQVLPNPVNHREYRSLPSWKQFETRWGPTKLAAFEQGSLSVAESHAILDDLLNRYPVELLQDIRKTGSDSARAVEDAGFVVYASGTTVNFGRLGQRHFWSYTLPRSLPLVFARVLGIPYGINAQSFEALEWPADAMFRTLFRGASFVYCRETDSLAYLRERNLLIAKETGFRPDTTFFFTGRDPEWAERFVAQTGLESKNFVTVTIRPPETSGPLANILTEERHEAQMAKLRHLIETLTAETDLHVLLCPETSSSLEATRKSLYTKLSPQARERTVYLDTFWSAEQAVSVYSLARIVISMEMHSIIMAVAAGTPFVHPTFTEAGRKRQMLRDIALGDWLLDIDEVPADQLLETVMRIHRDYEHARQRVGSVMTTLKTLAAGVMTIIHSEGRWNGP